MKRFHATRESFLWGKKKAQQKIPPQKKTKPEPSLIESLCTMGQTP